MNVQKTVDAKEVLKGLNDLQKHQVPYATSKATNAVLNKAQTEQVESMKQAFIIRRNAYLKRSIKMTKFATKRDLTASLSVAPIGNYESALAKFEAGGTKTGAGRIAIPSAHIRPVKTRIVSSAKRPRQLKNSFVSEDGHSIMQRVGRGRNQRVELAYALKTSVRIRPTLKFTSRVTQVIEREWAETMNTELANAIASAGL